MVDSEQNEKGRSFLSLQTFEYMLHDWPEWSRSIKIARKATEIGYPLPEHYEERQKWIKTQGGYAWKYAVKVMNDLGLPEHLWKYWLCCVYSDYETVNGSKDYSKIIDFWAKKREKFYPPLPYEVKVEANATRPGKFGPVTIEVLPAFAYRALQDKASLHALQVAKSFAIAGPHPVLDNRQWAKSQSQRSPRKSEARRRLFSGQCTIGDILREEAESQMIRDELEAIKKKYSKSERKLLVIKLKRKVYARVKDWFSDMKPFPKAGKGWWPKNIDI